MTWPFGYVDLDDNEIVLSSPLWFGHWSIHVPYNDVKWATFEQFWFGGVLRIERGSGGLVFMKTFGDRYLAIVECLGEKGVTVTRRISRVNTVGALIIPGLVLSVWVFVIAVALVHFI